jgi:high affinity Mn2+ porin
MKHLNIDRGNGNGKWRAICLRALASFASGLFFPLLVDTALADEANVIALPTADGVSAHFQSTFLPQGYLPFRHAPGDPTSGNGESTETWTITGYFGARVWEGGEVFFNPEMFHGWLLRDNSPAPNVAVAASVGNGEAQKGGRWDADLEVARLYISQTIGFGGEKETIKDDLNQIAGTKDVSRLTLTFGRLAANDIFDNNAYAHDPRTQFQNWALFDGGAFDYAADVKGYTVGAIADLNQKEWAFRAGYFLLPVVPNALALDTDFTEHGSVIAEFEKRYTLFSQPGKLRLTGFENHGILGNYAEAVALSPANPDIVATQKVRTNYGYVINFEQAITDKLGAFFRYSWNDGKNQLCCFTDITESVSGGLSIKGAYWGRPDDTIGIAGAFNEISPSLQHYLAAGGRGLLIGNGGLPNYAGEQVFETYYSFVLTQNLTVSADYQYIGNSAYEADRSPIHMFSGRVHVQF